MIAAKPGQRRFLLDDIVFDEATGTLVTSQETQLLTPKTAAVLACLADNAGQLVTREQLHEEVWAGRYVSDTQVSKAINRLRQALPEAFIETMPRRGYRLVCNVALEDLETSPDGAPHWRPATSLVAGLTIAVGIALFLWQQVGKPPPIETTAPLDSWQTPPLESLPLTSIAVLPFENVGENSDYDWLANAMAVELTETLARTPDFRLPARSSIRRLADSNADLPTIGRRLKAGTVVEGTVQVAGEELRVTVGLVRISGNEQILAVRYDRALTEIFDVQRAVAIDVAEAIRIELGVALSSRPDLAFARYEPENFRAYELLHQANATIWYVEDWFREDKRAAVRSLLDQALSLEPDYPSALAGKATEMMGYDSDGAWAIAERLAQLDPPRSFLILAQLHERSRNYEEAWRYYEKALTVETGPTVRLLVAEFLLSQFRHDEAIRQAGLAADLDPISPLTRFRHGAVLYHSGKYDEAIAEFEYAARMGDDSLLTDAMILRTLYRAGREREAAAMMRKVLLRSPFGSRLTSHTEYSALLEDGRFEESLIYSLDTWLIDCANTQADVGGVLGVLARLGRREEMYTCLDAAPSHYVIRLHDVDFEPYWQEPRFQALIEARGIKLSGL